MPKEELRGRLHIPPQRWPGIVGRLVAEGVLRDGGNTVSEIGHVGGVGSRVAEADRVQALLREYGLAPPGVEELAREAGTDPGLVKALADEHEIVHVGGGLYFARDVVECFCREVLSMIDERGAVSAAEVRDRVGTSRRFVLALLEYLDDRRITRRSGDVRVRGSKAAACV
jgi:selenocysteine-specific elongation factor